VAGRGRFPVETGLIWTGEPKGGGRGNLWDIHSQPLVIHLAGPGVLEEGVWARGWRGRRVAGLMLLIG
jgi:hypothetical protein